MKKVSALFILVVAALAIDGTLSYDIFDFRMNSWLDWLGLVLLLFVILVVVFAKDAKKSGVKHTSR